MSAPSDQDKTDQDLAGYLHRESPRRPEHNGVVEIPSSPPPGLTELPEGDMRDIQKSLVERIADVDDDRRRTAVQLRKAFESHRDEIRAQRRRDHTAMLVLTGIGITLLAAVLLLFGQLLQARNAVDARIAALEGRPAADAPAGEAPAAPEPAVTAEALASLSARVDALQEQLAATPAPAAEAADDGASEAATEQVGELADAIESIGDRLTALEGRDRGRTATAPDAERQADAETTVAAGERRVAELEARLGALLDERLASVEARIDEVRNDLRNDLRAAAPPAPGTAAAADDTGAEAPAGAETMTLSESMIVLQLAGVPSRDAVARFMDRHDELPATIYLKSDTRRGQAWYGIVHSLYRNMEAAEAALAALPADLAELDTWLRPLTEGTRLEVLSTRP